LLIDDFQIDFVSEPQQVGFDVGISSNGIVGTGRLRFDLQYTQIRNYVYGQVFPRNIFTNRGVIIGSSLGPDADRVRFTTSYVANRHLVLEAGAMFARKGEGRITDPQLGGVPKNEKFPSGLAQKKLRLHFGVSLTFAPLLDLHLIAGYSRIDNPENLIGMTESPFADLSVQYDFQRWFFF
jgi:hypothetical protein